LLIITAIAFLTYLSHETIEVVRKILNPVKYFNDKVKVTVNNHTVTNDEDLSEAVSAPEESTEDNNNEEPNDEEKPEEGQSNVVDLTDFSQFNKTKKPESAPGEIATTATAGKGEQLAETVAKPKDRGSGYEGCRSTGC
jgi:S-DNA-T family DNA segregation ATPase FtsK/SpoIIIE